jgi:hypothetical protein
VPDPKQRSRDKGEEAVAIEDPKTHVHEPPHESTSDSVGKIMLMTQSAAWRMLISDECHVV